MDSSKFSSTGHSMFYLEIPSKISPDLVFEIIKNFSGICPEIFGESFADYCRIFFSEILKLTNFSCNCWKDFRNTFRDRSMNSWEARRISFRDPWRYFYNSSSWDFQIDSSRNSSKSSFQFFKRFLLLWIPIGV